MAAILVGVGRLAGSSALRRVTHARKIPCALSPHESMILFAAVARHENGLEDCRNKFCFLRAKMPAAIAKRQILFSILRNSC